MKPRSKCSRRVALAAMMIMMAAATLAIVAVDARAAGVDAPTRVAAPVTDTSARAEELAFSDLLRARAAAIRDHIGGLIAAIPGLPADFGRAGQALAADVAPVGFAKLALLLVAAVALGFGLEAGLRRVVAGSWRWGEQYKISSASERLRIMASRAGLSAAGLIVFTLGTIGPLLMADLPPLAAQVALAYLLALCGFRLASMVVRVALASDIDVPSAADELRLIPMRPEAARQWHGYLCWLVGWFAFGKATVEVVGALGFSLEARRLVAYILGLGLLGIALRIVWRRRDIPVTAMPVAQQFAVRANCWLLSVYFVLLWASWVLSALVTFWLCAIVGALSVALGFTHRAVAYVARPVAPAGEEAKPQGMAALCIERAVRAALIVGAALLLVRAWDVNLATVAAGDSFFMRMAHAAVNILVIGLAADLAWRIVEALIERQLGALGPAGTIDPAGEESRHQARLRTLLPISKKLAAVVIFTIAALTMLSEAGIQIGPLIAGAGVIGLAVGFGAQTLVRDIFSGFFYLLDDAFRVGEYIQSGNYKGTVESFSIRSVRLRHHRGPLYTIPFGVLGAVQNMSRDWVIDVMSIGVTYDTNLDEVKKVIKQIGKQLGEDPELKPIIIEPLKMQGVQQFGDFAIQIRLKMMTRPGEQFVVRRRAYALIKKEFDARGIKFAFPTVQVAGGAENSVAAVARQAIEMTQQTAAQ